LKGSVWNVYGIVVEVGKNREAVIRRRSGAPNVDHMGGVAQNVEMRSRGIINDNIEEL
jgi:hypothetical protein